MKTILTLASLFLIQNIFAAVNIWDEARDLNSKFNSYQSHPIVVFEKDKLIPLLRDQSEEKQIVILRQYLADKVKIELERDELESFLPYFGQLNGVASALPIYRDDFTTKKFCAVFASDNDNNLVEETARTLGISGVSNPYPEATVEEVSARFSLDELKLFSLYHELSHCLKSELLMDLPSMGDHTIHMNEAFAETNALLMLYREKGMRRLGAKRAYLRSLYSKYMGAYLATTDEIIIFDDSIRAGGAIYYLSPTLLAAQRYIEDYAGEVKEASLTDLISITESIIKTNSLTSRQVSAMSNYLREGDSVIERYREFAQDMPDLMLSTYQFLLALDANFSTI